MDALRDCKPIASYGDSVRSYPSPTPTASSSRSTSSSSCDVDHLWTDSESSTDDETAYTMNDDDCDSEAGSTYNGDYRDHFDSQSVHSAFEFDSDDEDEVFEHLSTCVNLRNFRAPLPPQPHWRGLLPVDRSGELRRWVLERRYNEWVQTSPFEI